MNWNERMSLCDIFVFCSLYLKKAIRITPKCVFSSKIIPTYLYIPRRY